MGGLGRFVLAAPVLAVAAGCAAPALDVREGTAVVRSVERRGWDADTEQGLFRIEFDAVRMQAIRREAGVDQAPEGIDPYTTQLRSIDREADRGARGSLSSVFTRRPRLVASAR